MSVRSTRGVRLDRSITLTSHSDSPTDDHIGDSMRHREQPVTKRVTRYLVMAPTDLSTPTHPMGV